MAVLKHQTTHTQRSLAARSLVGRAPGCVLRLEDRAVSAEHASIFWTGERWEVRDLGSRNGTLVNGRKLNPGERAALAEGTEVSFGGAERWVLVDALPPVASARCGRSGEVRVAENGLLALPSPAEPIVSIFEDEGSRWLVEQAGEAARPCVDQERVVAGRTWCLSVPPPLPASIVVTTRELRGLPKLLSTVTLCFGVSRDEEYVELSLEHGDERERLTPRAHHYFLLTLARAMLEGGGDPSISPAERGWVYVDDLVTKLRTELMHLNVSIHRARQQLSEAGVLDAGALIERRPTTKQIRLGTDRVSIETL